MSDYTLSAKITADSSDFTRAFDGAEKKLSALTKLMTGVKPVVLTANVTDLNSKVDTTTKKVEGLTNGAPKSVRLGVDSASLDGGLKTSLSSIKGFTDGVSKLPKMKLPPIDLDSIKSDLQKAEIAVEGGMTGLSSKAKSASSSLAKAGGVATTASVPLMMFGKDSLNVGKDFEASMSQVAATMGITVDEIANGSGEFKLLRETAIQMGADTMFSASQAAEALNYIASAGYDATTATQVLPKVLNLAAAGGMDLASASDMVTSAAGAMGLGVGDLDGFIDQMSKTAQSTSTNVQQLGEGMITVGANARSLKGGTKELNIALGAMAKVGITGSKAGIQLRNIMMAMTPTTDDAVKAYKKLGVSAYDSQGNLRSLGDVFGDLSVAMSGMTEEQKSSTMMDIFNKDDLVGAKAIMSAVDNGAWAQLSTDLDGAAGSAKNMADTQMNNLSGDLEAMGGSLEAFQIKLASTQSGGLRDLVQGITKLINGLSNLSDGTLTAIAVILGLVAAIGPIAITLAGITWSVGVLSGAFGAFAGAGGIAGFVTGFGKLVGIFKAFSIQTTILTVKQWLLNAAMYANPVGLVVLAMVALIAVIVSIIAVFVHLWKTNEGFRNFFIDMWNGLCSVVGQFVKEMGDLFSGLWDSICSVFSQFIVEMGALFGGLWDSICGAFASARDGIVNIWGGLVTFFQGVWDGIVSIFSAVVGFYVGVYQAAWDGICTIWNGLATFFQGIFDSVFNIVSGVFGKIGEVIGNVFTNIQNAWSGLTGFIGGIFDGIVEAFNTVIQGVKDAINFVTSGINSAVGIINMIPGVEIGLIPQLARGTNNFQGGLARMNEGGRGELVGLPNGSTVVPHDISAQYARESARSSSGSVITTQNDNSEMVSWLRKLYEKDQTITMDGRTVGKSVAKHVKQQNDFNTNINNMLVGVR